MLIHDCEIINAEGRRHADIRCHSGSIVEISNDLHAMGGEEELDAGGRLVLPGGIDPHVHLELEVMGTRSSDDFESGTAAAVAGGTTTVIDFVHPRRGQDYLEALHERREEAAKAVCDYGLHMAVSWWGDGVPSMMRRCVQEEGIASFKAYTAYRETVGISDEELDLTLEETRRLGALLMVHCENDERIHRLQEQFISQGKVQPLYHALSRPCQAEVEAVEKVLALAAGRGAEVYLVHLSCDASVDLLARARAESRPPIAHGETCPHYLVLDESVYEKEGLEAAGYVLSPPIRNRKHQEVLWRALVAGTLEVLSTDHCPFYLRGQKDRGRDDFRKIPGGGAGIQDRLSLLWTYGVETGRLDEHAFVDRVSAAPARLFGLYPGKGVIQVGSDADLVLWDPRAERVISAATDLHRCDQSLYEGFKVKGAPSHVIAGGRVVYAEGDLRVERGAGRYLPRSRSAR